MEPVGSLDGLAGEGLEDARAWSATSSEEWQSPRLLVLARPVTPAPSRCRSK